MDKIDIIIAAVVGLIGLSFFDWKGVTGKITALLKESEVPMPGDSRLDCIAAVLRAIDVAKEHEHFELANELIECLPSAASCLKVEASVD